MTDDRTKKTGDTGTTKDKGDSVQDLPDKKVDSRDAESVKGGLGPTAGKHLA